MDELFSFDEDEFDFGLWCPVCDRQIPIPSSTSTNPDSAVGPIASTSKSASASRSAPNSSAPPNGTTGAGSAPKLKRRDSGHSSKSNLAHRRNKSSSKLTARGKSHTSLHALTSTALKPSTSIASPPASPALPPEPSPNGGGARPSAGGGSASGVWASKALYCSEECKRLDQVRTALDSAHLSPRLSHSPHPQPPALERRSSSSSTAALDFSTRRMSKGTESGSGYSFRPSLMQRVGSDAHLTRAHSDLAPMAMPIRSDSSVSLASSIVSPSVPLSRSLAKSYAEPRSFSPWMMRDLDQQHDSHQLRSSSTLSICSALPPPMSRGSSASLAAMSQRSHPVPVPVPVPAQPAGIPRRKKLFHFPQDDEWPPASV